MCNCNNHIIDAQDVSYKTACDEDSSLINIGIFKGASLEYIIEVLGNAVKDLQFTRLPKISNNPTLDTIEKVVLHFADAINTLQEQNEQLQETNQNLELRLQALENKKYNIPDPNGLGINLNMSLSEILEILTKNTNEL